MAGSQVAVAHEIIAEPEAVWNVLTDLDRRLKILTSVRALERLDGPPFGVGTRWRETRVMAGVPGSVEFLVTEVEPGLALWLDVEFPGARFAVVFRVRPSSLGTRLEADVTVESEASGLGKRMLGAVIGGRPARILGDTIEQDLRDVAAALRK